MGTSVLVVLSLKLRHDHMPSYTYYRNSIVGRFEDKDRAIRVSFTLHLNIWTTRMYLNTVDRNRITRWADNTKISLLSTYIYIFFY